MLTSEQYDIDDVADVVELLDIIKIAPTGWVVLQNKRSKKTKERVITNRHL
jgi:hypothetical protein